MRIPTLQLLATAALTACLWAAPAAAASFPDVPSDHWAYEAVDYLQGLGLVEGYPDGTFQGNRQLNRYEFAMVIARLYDKLVAMEGDGEIGPDVDAIYARLEEEFGAEIDELSQLLDEQGARIGDLETAFGSMSKMVDKHESMLSKLGKIKLTGDLRTRFESTTFDQPDTDNRNRARIRLRVTGAADVNKNIKATFRVATGDLGGITSTNESLEDNFALDGFLLDQAYLTYHDRGKDQFLNGWQVHAGKFAPNWVKTAMTFDGDVNVEGLGESFFMDDPHWRLNFAQLVPEPAGFYVVNQLGYDDLFFDGVDLYVAYHHMDHEAFSFIRKQADVDKTIKNKILFKNFHPDSRFKQFEVLGRLAINETFKTGYPMMLTGNYVQSDYDPMPGKKEVMTEAATITLEGGYAKNPGDWNWGLEYGRVLPNAVQTIWTDSDYGEGNTEYWWAQVNYLWLENTTLTAKVIDQNDWSPSNSVKGFTTIQLDAVVKF